MTEPVSNEQLKSFIERAERLNEEKAEKLADLKELFAEAKGMGYDTKIIKKIIAIRQQGDSARAEEMAILELYLSALGMGE